MSRGRAPLETHAPSSLAGDDAAYERLYPYYAEICALTELKKKPGFGVPIHSGIGGHSILYLNGVRRDRTQGYPVLELCAPHASTGRDGVGISVNSHYKNAIWVAAEGRDFLWNGALAQGERLTRDAYARTQAHAMAIGLLDGVQFHDHLFRDKPAAMSANEFKYEISIATDYGARFGRDISHARVPLDAARMGRIVDYLNALNMPYREGSRIFHWRVLNNNCCHVTHNALAAAGVWAPWPAGQFFARAAFNFPVPKNEFVDLMSQTNDLPIHDAQLMFENPIARKALLETGTLPTIAGALAVATSAVQDNDLYDTARLRLIFYDNPFWGPYRFRFARFFKEARYFDLVANLHHFAGVYEMAREQNRKAHGNAKPKSAQRAAFQIVYEQHIEREALKISRQLQSLQPQLTAVAS